MTCLHQSGEHVAETASEQLPGAFKKRPFEVEVSFGDGLSSVKSPLRFARTRKTSSATLVNTRDSSPLKRPRLEKCDSGVVESMSISEANEANQAPILVNGKSSPMRFPHDTRAEPHQRSSHTSVWADVHSPVREIQVCLIDVVKSDQIKQAITKNSGESEEERIEDQKTEKLIENVEREKKISFSHHQKTSESSVRRLVTAMRKTKHVEISKFKMRNCRLTTKLLKIISNGMKPRKIRTLDLSGNKGLDLRVIENIRNKMSSEILDLSDTELGEEEIKELGNIKGIKELRLNYKAFTHGSITDALIKLINNGLAELSLIDSKITEKQLQKIAKGLNDNVYLRVLDVSHVTLKMKGVIAIARIVNKSKQMSRLVISNCCLSTSLLKALENHVESKIPEFDVSSNPGIKDGGIDVLAALAEKLECVDLDVSSNRLNSTDIRKLLNAKHAPKQVGKLCLAENSGIDPAVVGELITKWKVQILDVSECRFSAKAIEDFQIALGKHKLQSIDVSDPSGTVSNEKRAALKKLSRKTQKLIFGNHEEWVEL